MCATAPLPGQRLFISIECTFGVGQRTLFIFIDCIFGVWIRELCGVVSVTFICILEFEFRWSDFEGKFLFLLSHLSFWQLEEILKISDRILSLFIYSSGGAPFQQTLEFIEYRDVVQ